MTSFFGWCGVKVKVVIEVSGFYALKYGWVPKLQTNHLNNSIFYHLLFKECDSKQNILYYNLKKKMIFVKLNFWSCSIKRLQNASAWATLIDFDMEKVHRRFYGDLYSLHYEIRRMSRVIECIVTFKTCFSSQIMHGFSWSFLFLLYF